MTETFVGQKDALWIWRISLY